MTSEPVAEIDARYSDPGTGPTPWQETRRMLAEAGVYWLTTIRPEGGPHITPLIGVWLDAAMWFCTGPEERKARNLAAGTRCALTTGRNELSDGLDIVVEGDALRETDEGVLRRVADLYETKYGSDWHFEVRDGGFHHGPGQALVFRVAPRRAYAYAKGPYAQTRYRFPEAA